MLSVLLAAVAWWWVAPNILRAQVASGISEPLSGDEVSGVVVVRGTAIDTAFLRYEIAFSQGIGTGSDWIVFAQGDQPVIDGNLAVWNTTVGGDTNPIFPDGRYQLRLRVVRTDYNYDEYFVHDIRVNNSAATPTPTLTVAAENPTIEATFGNSSVLGTSSAVILPSLTPFPTPSPLATLAEVSPRLPGAPGQPSERGLLGQLSNVDTSRFGKAFWQGVTVVAVAFGALAVYLIIRGALRWLRRFLLTKLLR